MLRVPVHGNAVHRLGRCCGRSSEQGEQQGESFSRVRHFALGNSVMGSVDRAALPSELGARIERSV